MEGVIACCDDNEIGRREIADILYNYAGAHEPPGAFGGWRASGSRYR